MGQTLPKQFRWKDFKKLVEELGYVMEDPKGGSARTFRNPARDPEFVTFHEPHKPKHLKQGTLREYLRKLKLSREEFFKLIK